ncbi:MAG: hypothetical protein G01um101416_420 [Microgenomates group bacterium Gr01-1014_16]|nr:MAG: hypothetical protein G01um101416_420 [Microgenomates group bacterium Gr01-1014_16]
MEGLGRALNNVVGLPLANRLYEQSDKVSFGRGVIGTLEFMPHLILVTKFMSAVDGSKIDTWTYLLIISSFVLKAFAEHELQKVIIPAQFH